MYPTYTPPETTAADVFTAFGIGFDLLPTRIDADAIIKTIAENPMSRLDILIAGILELVDTLPAEDAIGQIRGTAYGVAELLDDVTP
jgi:hypothetical protein